MRARLSLSLSFSEPITSAGQTNGCCGRAHLSSAQLSNAKQLKHNQPNRLSEKMARTRLRARPTKTTTTTSTLTHIMKPKLRQVAAATDGSYLLIVRSFCLSSVRSFVSQHFCYRSDHSRARASMMASCSFTCLFVTQTLARSPARPPAARSATRCSGWLSAANFGQFRPPTWPSLLL